jgi:hypothetical protein
MASPDQCRFLQVGPVFICSAFIGGLRTPRDVEMERLCRTVDHSRCPYFLARMRREAAGTSDGTVLGGSGDAMASKEVP